MKKLSQLKAAFLEEGIPAVKVAKMAGIPNSYLSQAINGRYVLDESQMQKIAEALNRKPDELFG
jgi:transcriptional regulator with XRE-family HTH domain